jgi:hypothetical protein
MTTTTTGGGRDKPSLGEDSATLKRLNSNDRNFSIAAELII